MTEFREVPLAVPPTEFDDLTEGTHTLHAPFFTGNAEGGALQVGLQPNEYESDQKHEVAVTVTGEIGQRAIALSRLDGLPFTIENSDDGDRAPVLSRAVRSLIVAESLGLWLEVKADGDDPLDVDAAGINYLTKILTTYTLSKQTSTPAHDTSGQA